MSSVIISDTSCLIVLSKINRLSILENLFTEIIITPEVAHEFGEQTPDWISIKPTIDKVRVQILELELDKGEASAIALGLETENCLLLIDEKKGRKKASDLGLKILGTLGVLIKARERNIVQSLRTEIEKLEEIGFRMSNSLITNILKKYN